MKKIIEILLKTMKKAAYALIFLLFAINIFGQKVEEKLSVQKPDTNELQKPEIQKQVQEVVISEDNEKTQEGVIKLQRLTDEIEKQNELKVEEKVIEVEENVKLKRIKSDSVIKPNLQEIRKENPTEEKIY